MFGHGGAWTSRAVLVAAAAVLGAVLSADALRPAEAQDAAATQTFESAKGEIILKLPASWEVEQLPANAETRLVLRAQLPDGGPRVGIWGMVNRGIRNGRGRAVYELPTHIENYRAEKHAIGHEPVEHLWTETPDRADERHLWATRHVHRVDLAFVFEIPGGAWDLVYGPALECVKSADTRLADTFDRPSEFKPVEKDGYVYLVHPEAKDRDVTAFHAQVMAAEKRYAATHGPIPKPPENPMEIVFNARATQSEAFVTSKLQGTPWSKLGLHVDGPQGVLVAAPLSSADDRARAEFRYVTSILFHTQCFDLTPYWMKEMEAWAEWMEGLCGRPLPSAPESALSARGRSVTPFADLVAKSRAEVEGDRDSLLAYCALFRCGPKEYREAWEGFLAELRATGDWRSAERTLLELDQRKLAAAAEAFRDKSLKPVKGK